MLNRLALLLLPVLAVPLLVAAPAEAAARVRIANQSGEAVIDATYATTLTLSGSGFQSIRNGHGGIYVLFGTVSGSWKPSAHGAGTKLTVPDAQTKNNAGYAKFVAFPGSDTAGSANGGTISANGTWTTKLTVPGAVFTTYDGGGKTVKVDCRKVTCGVLTIGAHGVTNARNETFTPVRVGNLYPSGSSTSTTTTTTTDTTSVVPSTPAAQPGAAPAAAPAVTGPAALEVDRGAAKPGRVLAFSATGLVAGSQVSATFADGRAGVGPLTVGANGQLAGLLRLPADLTNGTYELRLVGDGDLPSVRFAVVASSRETTEDRDWVPVVFTAGGAAALLAAIAFAVLTRRRRAS